MMENKFLNGRLSLNLCVWLGVIIYLHFHCQNSRTSKYFNIFNTIQAVRGIMKAHNRRVIRISICQYVDRRAELEFPDMEFKKNSERGYTRIRQNQTIPA